MKRLFALATSLVILTAQMSVAAGRLVRSAAEGDWGRSPQVILRGGAKPHACKTKKTTTRNTNHPKNENTEITQKNIHI